MKVIKFLLPVIFAAFLFGTQSCNKYEEGPAISLRTKKARVVNEWTLKEYYENGKKQDIDDPLDLIFEKDQTGYFVSYDDGGDQDVTNFNWEFNSDKTKILMTYVDEDGKVHENQVWALTILKLYENELWLKSESDDETDEYHFETK